jgi:hypothetical protein
MSSAAFRGKIPQGKIMDEQTERSCWGVTAKAVLGVAVVLLLAWLVGGVEPNAVIAAG